MRSVTLLALGLMLVGAWSHDSAKGQTSAAPPVSLAPPKASLPRASAKNSPAASDRVSSTPATGGVPQPPNPAADYDGFSAVDDNDTPEQTTRATTSRAAKGSKPNPDTAQQSIDQEDEALKRKLTICKSCK